MGPSTLIDGDWRGSGARSWAARLQWGRRLSSTETDDERFSRERYPALQWGRRLSSTETRQGADPTTAVELGFNGAVDSHRRRRRVAPRATCTGSSFNGAVDSHRRRRRLRVAELGEATALQWGRRLSSTETPSRRLRRSSCGRGFNGAVDSHRRRRESAQSAASRWPASMGPSTLIDGDAEGQFCCNSRDLSRLKRGERSLWPCRADGGRAVSGESVVSTSSWMLRAGLEDASAAQPLAGE